MASVGSIGDRYDNALAEAFNSLVKAVLVRNRGPWKGIDDLEIAVANGAPPTKWGNIDWFNHRRLHGEIGLVPPAEYEDAYYRHNPPRHPSERQVGASTEPGAGHRPAAPRSQPALGKTLRSRSPARPQRSRPRCCEERR